MRGRLSLAFWFVVLIACGALALSAPFARQAGTWGGWSDAAFTACSAVCVTGLSVVDIAQAFTREGQLVLIALVECGALGLMALGTFLLIAVGRRLSYASEFSLMNAYGVAELKGIRGLVLWIVGSMTAIQSLGALLLYYRFRDWYLAVFYSAMSFCNAGFSIYPDSLARFAGDPYVLLVLAVETILGGIGFLVIYNLCTFKFLRRKSGARGRLSLHSTVVLRFSLALTAIAFVLFLVIEWNGAMRGLDAVQKLWVAFYQAVTPRSCGFTVLPLEKLNTLTIECYWWLMLIGGGPGSVAGGIKVTTFAVLVYTIFAMCRGELETVIHKRAIAYDVVRESIVIVVMLMLLGDVFGGILVGVEPKTPMSDFRLYFETMSAVTTTGLSIGNTTAELSSVGRLVIMLAMFCGRLGALTVVLMIGSRESKRHVRYPSEELVVG